MVPPVNPDINPSENLWSISRNVCENRKPYKSKDLLEAIETLASSVKAEIVENLIKSLNEKGVSTWCNG